MKPLAFNYGANQSMTLQGIARTPIALAIVLLPGLLWAQPAPNTTSADVPEAKSLFETGGQPGIGPRPYTSFLERLSSPVEKINIKIAADNLLADGVTGTDILVNLLDAKGQPLQDDVDVTIEVNGGARILLPGRLTSEAGPDRGDIDRIQPGTQAKVKAGALTFKLIAPYQPDSVVVRVSVRGVSEKATIRYVPDLREMIAVGLIEGRLRSDKFDSNSIVPARENDGFDQELRGFTKEFNGGKSNLGLRAAMYLKGKILGKYLLTMAYDSDKDTNKQLFQTIDPNAFYPVYGDSSVRGADAQSTGKLYVRIDQNLSYLLYGDYTTTDTSSARALSQYSRSLPGLRGHLEEGGVVANVFAAQQSLTQVVDEFAARGVSGPYTVSNPNGIKGTEKVEILVRSRFQTSVILKATPLTRSTDYEFEPFDGKILFRTPVPSVDDQLNPVSIRVTYEVEQGGDRFFVYGGDVRLKLSDSITVGVAAAKDSNPNAPYTVSGANLQLKLSKSTELIAEVARSNSVVNTLVNGYNANNSANFLGKTGEFSGNAARIEIRQGDEKLRARAYVQRADDNFNNASSGLTGGKQEIGVEGVYKVSPDLTLTAEAKSSEDRITTSKNDSGQLTVDLKLTERLTFGAGVRYAKQNEVSLAQQTNSNCLTNSSATSAVYTGTIAGYNTGYGINQVGNQTIDPATGLPVVCNTAVNPVPAPAGGLDRQAVFGRLVYKITDKLTVEEELQHISGNDATNTYKLGARYAATDTLSFAGDFQHEFSGSNGTMYKLGADWRVADKTRVYSRYEFSNLYGGAYGLGTGPLSRAFALGIDTQYMQDGSLYSEYRLADTASGRAVQNAIGLRNGWNVAEGIKLNTNAERLISSSGGSTALGAGVEYTASEFWKGSGRLEWRRDKDNANWLLTAGVARKLDRDWTLIGRDYLSLIQPRTDAAGVSRQNRAQVGFAYRPVDNNKFDALGLYEHKTAVDGVVGTQNKTDVVSLRGNYHPSRTWWVSGRFATKNVNELLLGSVNDSYHASLLGARVTYDITNRWSLGGITTVLVGKDGGKQYAFGLEAGYTVMDNLLMTVGYNWRGFRDDDLTGSDYTNRGWVLGVRYKFDETLFGRDDGAVNRTLNPGATAVVPTTKP
jgi:hypothetical protein